MPFPISSTHNPRIKQLLALEQKSAERKHSNLFVVEGQRELKHCIENGWHIESLYICPEIIGNHSPSPFLISQNCYEVTRNVYQRIAFRESTEGVIGVVRSKNLKISDLELPSNPLIVVLESVEKPGNLGAILRSADAAGATAVIICDALTDLYNPNLIRSSIGAIFSVPCLTCDTSECIAFLKNKKIQILTAQLQDSHVFYDADMRGPTAIVMGTESTGLSPKWRLAANDHIRIPMLGHLDSLNVSVSTAILLYEAVRQRR